ncbi:MAG: hypothetical protein HQL51_00385 [Magnetococcales bacterium]|nr:hypothetical protein [Magnetococcales bacterium]
MAILSESTAVIDSSLLLFLADPMCSPPLDPDTNHPIERARDRIEHLIRELGNRRTVLLIPAPVLAESLVRAEAGFMPMLNHARNVRIVPFDYLAAEECASLLRRQLENKENASTIPQSRQCAKVDLQIVAIARTRHAEVLYTQDAGMRKLATHYGLDVKSLQDIAPPQIQLPLPLEKE